jgi:hypothetical protein
MHVARRLPDQNHTSRIVFRRAKVYFQRIPGKQGTDAERAIAGVEFTVRVHGQVVGRGVTGSDGSIVFHAPAGQPIELSIFGTTYSVKFQSEKPPADELRGVQRRLMRLGYEPGNDEGTQDLGTERAVLSFQADNGLDPDGEAGTRTQQAIDNLSVIP